jgi:hypothetical protein
MSFAHGPVTVVQTPSGRYKGKKITKPSGLAWLGLVWFGLFQLTLHNILGEVPSCVFALVCVKVIQN